MIEGDANNHMVVIFPSQGASAEVSHVGPTFDSF